MKSGDRVTHKNKKYIDHGLGEVRFISDSGLVFVTWPDAKERKYPAYYKRSSLIITEKTNKLNQEESK